MNVVENPMLAPMAAYVFYLFFMFLFVFIVRFRVVKAGNRDIGRYFKTYADKSKVPERFLVMERHVDNQFQVPMIFFVTGILAIALQRQTTPIVSLAWLFVISRFVHTYIHLGTNKLLKRAGIFAVGWFCLVAIWVFLLV